jgi:hypothetical protein
MFNIVYLTNKSPRGDSPMSACKTVDGNIYIFTNAGKKQPGEILFLRSFSNGLQINDGKRFFLFIIVCLLIGPALKGQEYAAKELRYKPVNLQEAVEQLKILHHDSTKQKIRAMTEDEFIGRAHFGLGMWMRNNWGLWKGKELAGYFNSIGIYHADDMSGIILTSYYRELHGQDWKVDAQVKYHQDYWKKSSEHLHKMETDTAYRKKILAQNDSLVLARFEQKKLEWSSGKRVAGYVDQRCGLLKDFALRTKIEGTIIEWKEDKLLLHIDKYVDGTKKERVTRCYDIKNDIILVEDHELFHLVEK